MKKLLPALLFLCFAATAFAQTANDVIGNWQFVSIPDSAGLEESKKSTMSSLLQTMAFNFKEDKTYSGTILGLTEMGSWVFKDKAIELTNNKGGIITMDVLAFEKDKLTLKLKTIQLVLGRVGTAAALPPTATKKVSYVAATKAQLSQKWFLTGKTAPDNLSQQQKEALAESLAGSYLQLKPNGSYTNDVSGVIENGSWSLLENNTALQTKKGSTTRLWHIVKISATDLTLELDGANQEWTFTTVEE